MKKARGSLRAHASLIGESSVAQLADLFARWVNLKGDFINPKRQRLFPPRKNLLDVPVSSA